MDNAIKLSKSLLPQEKQIAVIIFDHLIEIVLFNAVKTAFEWGAPLSISEDINFDSKTRKSTLYKYDSVIKFAKKLQYLDNQDESLLTFNHNIRNELYHKGDEKIDNTILALIIYFHFIKKNKKFLTSKQRLTKISGENGYELIDFGQGLKSDDPMFFLDTSKYINDAFDYLTNSFPDLGKFQDLASEYLIKTIKEIEYDIEYVNSTYKSINFYDALSTSTCGDTAPIFKEFSRKKRKPKSIDSILLTSSFFRIYEDRLNDLSLKSERYSQSKKFLKFSRKGKKGKYSNWVNLSSLKARAHKLKNEEIEIAIQNFNGMNNNIKELLIDLGFATAILSGYEMFLYDLSRGK